MEKSPGETIEKNISVNIETKKLAGKWIGLTLLMGGISVLFAYISNRSSSIDGWMGFLAIFILLSLVLASAWKYIQQEQVPKYLLSLALLAILIRLFLGLVWFVAFPNNGYDTEMQEAGYVMGDAFSRDTAAWEYSQTHDPLLLAFQDYSHTDQYGGLIFLSAFVYRYLGTTVHQPLLMVVFSAIISSMAVFFVWGIANHTFGKKAAKIAAWLLVFYPEAGLLGSSQMREAYSITLLVLLVHVFIRYVQNKNNTDLAILSLTILASFLLSTPFAISSLLFLSLIVLWRMDRTRLKNGNRWLNMIAVIFILIVVVGIFIIGIDKIYGVDYQEYLSVYASGKITQLFERIPTWTHTPFLVGYGIVRPLLPAALADFGNPIWTTIQVWRAIGWTVMLSGIIYSSFLVLKEKVLLKIPGVLLIFIWFGILISSYRGAGDDWDNPRYRAVFAGLQVIFVAWGLIRQKETKDPWLRRGIGFISAMVLWFMVWYINRNVYFFNFPTGNLSGVIGLGLASGVLISIWDWLKSKKNDK